MNTIVLRAGSVYPEILDVHGDFDDWFRDVLPPGATVIDPTLDGLPAVDEVDACLVTGSLHSVLERTPWLEALEVWIAAVVAARVPVLGVCYGHQLLASALGGRVAANEDGRHIGSFPVSVHGEGTAAGWRLPPRFEAAFSHHDQVVEAPEGIEVLASSPSAEVAMFRAGSAVGVQFHPELTPELLAAIRGVESGVPVGREGRGLDEASHGLLHRWLGEFVARTFR